ncbi:MAG: hypothetical protein J5I62_07690 [Flavobacteriales bacterium]|nr:hypothetical protein [Flavobacteriales bacterium]
MAKSGDGEIDVNGYRYQTINGFGLMNLQDCSFSPGFHLQAGVELVVAELPILAHAGCANFNIVNDSYTGANNKNYYSSVGGWPSVGIIYSPGFEHCGTVFDCPGLGLNIGDPCDDGDASTGNDVVNASCECVGQPIDCNGDIGGTAVIDNCGECVGGNTGAVACVQDCNGDWGGTAYLDNCGPCVGGNTGQAPCVADCNGDFGGTAYLDNCGECVGGTTGAVACVQDCTGDCGGTALIDNCGDCVGGTTGAVACVQD